MILKKPRAQVPGLIDELLLFYFFEQFFSVPDSYLCVFVSAFFIGGFGPYRRDGGRAFIIIKGNESQMGSSSNYPGVGIRVFADYADADFHGSPACIVDGGF